MKGSSSRRLAVLALALGMAMLLVTGCPQREAVDTPAAEPVRVAMFILVRANAYDQARIDGVNTRVADLNADVDVFSCEFDTRLQIIQIQDAIATGKYDAFIIHPNDSHALIPVINEALAEGIIVIGADAPIGPDTRSLNPYPAGVTAMIGRTGWDTGTWLGEAVVEASRGKTVSRVAYLIGIQALGIDQDRFAAFEAVIAQHPHIQLVAFQEGQYRRDVSLTIMQNVFQAQPDISVVVSSGDQMTLGAHDAAVRAGIADRIKFIGNGASAEGVEAVRDGRFFATVADIPFTQGQLLIEAAVKAVRGEAVQPTLNLNDQRPPLPPGGPVITRENVDQFQGQW